MCDDVDNGATFEVLRNAVSAARHAEGRDQRFVHWVGNNRKLAYARDRDGRLELFISGERLQTQVDSVARRIELDSWRAEAGGILHANRIVFPKGVHVEALFAAVLAELVRQGVETDSQGAFSATERLIALAFKGGGSSENAVTGLASELLLLEGLVDSRRFSDDEIAHMWRGYSRSSRDFVLGSTGVEVKATTQGVSRHHIQGWYQVEPGVSVGDGLFESRLFLLSVGVDWLPVGVEGRTIENILTGMRDKLADYVWRELVSSACRYCGENFVFDPDGVNSGEVVRRPFQVGFVRMYDLMHDRIDVLRSADVHRRSHVVGDSVSFDIVLPEFIDRTNPICGLPAVLDALIESGG
jgi:hypothetical protein